MKVLPQETAGICEKCDTVGYGYNPNAEYEPEHSELLAYSLSSLVSQIITSSSVTKARHLTA
jgi:hypothetical protein